MPCPTRLRARPHARLSPPARRNPARRNPGRRNPARRSRARSAAALGAILAALLLSPPAARAEDRSCAVVSIDGPQARGGAAAGGDAALGPLSEGPLPAGGYEIETGADTRLRVECSDGVAVTVGAGTRIELTALIGPAGAQAPVLLRLRRGAAGIAARIRNWAGFAVETPLTIATIRSTEWAVLHDPAEDSSAVFVREGAVQVSDPAGTDGALLTPGEGVDVAPAASGGMAAPARWSPSRVDALGETLGFDWR